MKYEIDQSGKLEQLNTHTVVAFSNDINDAVILKAVTKRAIISRMRKSIIPQRDILPIWFAIVIFILVKNVSSHAVLVIDEEYTGKEAIIKEALKKMLNKRYPRGWRGSIRFSNVGKSSPAHQIAWSLHRKTKGTSYRKLKLENIMKFVK
jgi:hypothetical protein